MDQDKGQGQGQGSAHKAPNYMAIFCWLAGLTVVEVGLGDLAAHDSPAASSSAS